MARNRMRMLHLMIMILLAAFLYPGFREEVKASGAEDQITLPIDGILCHQQAGELFNVDVVFWTRADSEGVVNEGLTTMSEEELEAHKQEKIANLTEEETAIMSALHDSLPGEVFKFRDMPEGTITTSPYYTDLNVLVTLK